MIGLFVGEKGLSIFEGGPNPAPQLVSDPAGRDARYRLLGVDAVLVDGEEEPRTIAFYEQIVPNEWEREVRKAAPSEATQ